MRVKRKKNTLGTGEERRAERMGGEEKTSASETMKGAVQTAIGYLTWGFLHIFNAELAAGCSCLPGCLSHG